MLIHKGYQGSHFDYLGHSSVKSSMIKYNLELRALTN